LWFSEKGETVSELFSPFNPLKILHYSDRLQPLIYDGKIPEPAMVSFDFANPCDHRCVWCSWTKHRREEGGFLQPDMFESAISDCVSMGVQGFEVCGGGEALLNPHAHKYIAILGSIGKLLLITNGSRLTKEDAFWSKTIRVSLDAATPETHMKLHQSNDFEQILDNVQTATEVTRVGLGFLIHPDNYTEIPAFAELAKELGCEFAHIRPCYTDYPEIRDVIGYDWFEWIQQPNIESLFVTTNLDTVAGLIHKAKQLETDDFKVYATLYKTKPKKDWTFKKCYAPYLNPQITPSGGVWICCEQRGVPDSLIGVIGVDGGLKDIWLSDRHRELMETRPNDLCYAKCKFRGYNKAIWEAYVEDRYDLEWT